VFAAAGEAEIIVVDDASEDDTQEFLSQNYPQIKLVRHNKNQRFAAACNSGVKAASGKVVVLINNDVVPDKNFLKPLLAHFLDPQVFAVGCKEINNRKTGEASGRACGDFRRGLLVHWKCESQETGTTLWVSGGSGAFNKALWIKLGGMDTLFRPAYEEDRDISYRALKAGYQVLFDEESVVFHHHETTNQKALGKKKMEMASYKNHLLFVWKNITQINLIGQHLLWLPYHLVVTNFKSRGLFGLGFIAALSQLPKTFIQRQRAKSNFVLSDKTIIRRFNEK